LTQYQVDAFAGKAFEGNPAAVCPLDHWIADNLLQAIAEENNLSETAFFVPAAKRFHLRWFTPVAEVDFCGHATLASAHVLFEHLGYQQPTITFETRSGEMTVARSGEGYVMNFPSRPPTPCVAPPELTAGLGAQPAAVLADADYLAVFENEAVVCSLNPDSNLLRKLDLRGVIATAPGIKTDFVSRFFAPKYGIDEDPVTGSAHCELTPYWARRLGKTILSARQVSRRGGDILCELAGDRVILTGCAVTFMEAKIMLPELA